MKQCYLCGKTITEENKSVEHIVLNSLGGRLKSAQLICRSCNSKFGNTIDANLSKQLNFFANFLDIKRENGTVPDVEMLKASTGEKFKVTSKGIPILAKPLLKETPCGDGTTIQIKARSEKELKGILIGLRKKHPTVNPEECMGNATKVKEYISEPLTIELTIGGEESFPAILKMAINYYIEKTGDIASVKDAINDLKNNLTNKVEPIILKDPLFDLAESEVVHSIFVNCSGTEHKIYAIIELYSSIQFVVKLSEHYSGDDEQDLYVYDVLERKELKREIKTPPSFSEMFVFKYSSSRPDFALLRKRIERLIAIGTKRKNQIYVSEAIAKTMAATLQRLPEGHIITAENISLFVNEFMKNIEPFFANNFSCCNGPS